jgi:hypothetical protein
VNDANWGKHRTEDTEDAEGDWGLVVDNVDTGLQGVNDANGESIAQRTRRTQRRIGDWWWTGGHRDFRGERRELGKASYGGHKGEIWGWMRDRCRICVFSFPC